MQPWLPWTGFGAAGAFLLAAAVSALLRGPAWPYLLMLSALSLLVALLTFLRAGTKARESSRAPSAPPGGRGGARPRRP